MQHKTQYQPPPPASNERLEAAVALAAYGKHHAECVALDPYHVERPDKPCTCGFRSAHARFSNTEQQK